MIWKNLMICDFINIFFTPQKSKDILMNNSLTDKIKESVIPSVITGAIGAGVYYFMYNIPGMENIKVPFGPLELSPIMAIGAASGLGNLVGETATHFVLPHIQSMGLVQKEEFIVPPILSGVSTYLVSRFMVSENAELLPTFLIGAGSSAGAKYVYGMVDYKSL